MNDTKILQAILNNQVLMKKDIGELKQNLDKGFKNVSDRIDKLGKSLAYLEDDAPTMEEHTKLEKRVVKIEKKLILSS